MTADTEPRSDETHDPYEVCVRALRESWIGGASPSEVVGWMFVALDAAGDRTIQRHDAARERAITMVGMVFIDLGDPTDAGAVVSNGLRAANA